MKIYFISDYLYIDSSGAKTLAWAHKYTLEKKYGENNVRTIALIGGNSSENLDEKLCYIRGSQSKIWLEINSLFGYTTYLDKKGIKTILNIIRKDECDLIFIDNSFYGKLVCLLKKEFPNIPIATFYHDVKAYLAKDWLKKASLVKKPIYRAMISGEKLNVEFADMHLVLNKREADRFEKKYGKKPDGLLPIYSNISEPDINKQELGEPLSILFVGGCYGPNVEGIDWFIRNVFNNVSISSKLIVAGNNMSKVANKYKGIRNIQFYDYVENLSSLYNSADVIIGPIFNGAGMKVKTMEALAYGKVFVGTKEALEGYENNIPKSLWNKYIFMANNEYDFYHALECIKKDKSLNKYNKCIRRVYECFYSDDMAEKTVGEFFSKLANEEKE